MNKKPGSISDRDFEEPSPKKPNPTSAF
jgi:hypothetical protein